MTEMFKIESQFKTNLDKLHSNISSGKDEHTLKAVVQINGNRPFKFLPLGARATMASCPIASALLLPSSSPTVGRLGCALAGNNCSFLLSPSPALVHRCAPRRNNRGASRKPVVLAARIESKGVSLGSRAPDFELEEPLTGNMWKLEDFESYPALLVMFVCNHCPFVKHLKKDIVKLTNFYVKKGLGVVAISSNSIVTHPQDGPVFMAEDARNFNYPFPYLYDHSQDVARAFGAVCTPEFYLFKKDGRRPFELVYHGQFDDSRPSNNVSVTGRDLSLAIDCVLSGQPIPPNQKPSVGCSIKWHPEGHV